MGEGSAIIKQLRNPAYGLVPLLVFTILVVFVDAAIAMAIGLGLSLLGIFAVRIHSRMLYDISFVTFFLAFMLQLFYASLNSFGKFVVIEIVFVVILTVSRLMRTRLINLLAKNDNLRVKNYFSESFRVAFLTQYGLFFHLLLVLSYFNISTIKTPWISALQIIVIVQLIIMAIIVFEVIKFAILNKKLRQEEWLPVVTESGRVMGKVAKSVSQEMKNKFMHPVVRVALINNGKIYLKEREASRLLNPGALDYPFEKYMKYNHDIDEAVQNAIRKEIGIENVPLCFLLKYIFENTITKRLIFLYASVINDDEKFNRLRLTGGKLWTVKQIEDNADSKIFSECFELEFEYLKNTVLRQCQLKPIEAS